MTQGPKKSFHCDRNEYQRETLGLSHDEHLIRLVFLLMFPRLEGRSLSAPLHLEEQPAASEGNTLTGAAVALPVLDAVNPACCYAVSWQMFPQCSAAVDLVWKPLDLCPWSVVGSSSRCITRNQCNLPINNKERRPPPPM